MRILMVTHCQRPARLADQVYVLGHGATVGMPLDKKDKATF